MEGTPIRVDTLSAKQAAQARNLLAASHADYPSFLLSLGRKLQMMPALLGVALVAGGAFLAFARVGSTLEQAHPADRAWYLQALGVHPRAQRRGIGRLLLVPVLALADEAGLACHLHTADPANIGYYRRFGFEIIEPALQVFLKGPSYIGMTRPAPVPLGGVPVPSTHRAN